ncbi:hypothetical protein ACSPAH_12510 [Buttiauxella agrestis]
MNYRTLSMILSLTASIYSNTVAAQIDVAKTSELIVKMTDVVCGEMIYDGRKHSEELSLEASAKVNNILKEIADIGGNVKGNVSRSGYYGVLQEQLGGAIKNNQDCRKHVWDDLKVLFVDQPVKLPELEGQKNPSVEVVGNCNQTVTGSVVSGSMVSTCKP